MRGKRHSDEIRAQVIAALLAGQGVMEVASQYNLDASIVSRWKNGIGSQDLQVIATKKSDQIEQLLFNYLTANLAALEAQAIVVSESSYVKQQPADSLAVLHGVMADKAIRLLEAVQRAREAAQQPNPPE